MNSIDLQDNIFIVKIRERFSKNSSNMGISITAKMKLKLNSNNIVFDYNNLTIRASTIMDEKTYKLNRLYFGMKLIPDLIGDYEAEMDGDLFYLYKI